MVACIIYKNIWTKDILIVHEMFRHKWLTASELRAEGAWECNRAEVVLSMSKNEDNEREEEEDSIYTPESRTQSCSIPDSRVGIGSPKNRSRVIKVQRRVKK